MRYKSELHSSFVPVYVPELGLYQLQVTVYPIVYVTVVRIQGRLSQDLNVD